MLILFIVSLFLVTKHPLENEITVLDMEQGRSIFLRDMTGKTILLDIGEKLAVEKKEAWQEKVTSSIAKRSLIPYLKSRGVAKIDQLVLTTSDTKQLDHVLEISKAFELEEILVTEEALSKREFMDKLKETKIKVAAIKTGQQLFIFGSSLEASLAKIAIKRIQGLVWKVTRSNLSSYWKYRGEVLSKLLSKTSKQM